MFGIVSIYCFILLLDAFSYFSKRFLIFASLLIFSSLLECESALGLELFSGMWCLAVWTVGWGQVWWWLVRQCLPFICCYDCSVIYLTFVVFRDVYNNKKSCSILVTTEAMRNPMRAMTIT